MQSQHAPKLSVVVKPIKISQKSLVIDRLSKLSLRPDSRFCIDEPIAFTDNMQATTDYIPTEPTKPESAVKMQRLGAQVHRNLRVFGSIKLKAKCDFPRPASSMQQNEVARCSVDRASPLTMFTKHALTVINGSKPRNSCYANCIFPHEKRAKKSSANTSVASSAGRYSAASRDNRVAALAKEIKWA